MNEQNKAPEKEFNKMETNNLPDVKFKTPVIRMLNKLREEQMNSARTLNIENRNMKMESIEGNQSEMKSTLERINRVDEAEDCISNLEEGVVEETQSEQQEQKNNPKKCRQFKEFLRQYQA